MTIVNVNLQLEADSPEDAQRQIEKMKLPKGTKVFATMQQEIGPPGMNEVDAKGKLVEHQLAPPPDPLETES